MKNIIFCGFMGSGKTSVGMELASLLNRNFIDMDDYIEKREGKAIPAIFEAFGEEGFREREHAAVLELAGMDGLVIASGGGALTRNENVEALRKSGVVVFLNAGFEACYDRIADSDRPLVRKNSRERLESLYNERKNLYRLAADFENECAGNLADIAETVARQLSLASN